MHLLTPAIYIFARKYSVQGSSTSEDCAEMMSRFCLLAISVLCLPLGCLGGLNQCAGLINAGVGPPTAGMNNYKAYKYEAALANTCDSVDITCAATIPTERLRGRTWFITNIRPSFGRLYENNVIHDFRVQCPKDTYLHLVVQRSDLPRPTTGTPCTAVDFVRIGAVGLPTDEVNFCGDDNFIRMDQSVSSLYNMGRGRIFADGSANISFCSNNVEEMGMFDGFVIRASCLDPAEFQLPGCVDLGFFRAWDPGFTEQIFNDFAEVDKITLPHKKKRSVSWAMRQMQREKRFTGKQESLDLTAGATVTYIGSTLTVSSNLTTDDVVVENIGCFIAFSNIIGTRFFFGEAPLTFYGPGTLEYTRSFATLRSYTIPFDMIQETFIPGLPEIEAANRIYQHIFNNWIFPYPVIDNTDRTMSTTHITFPLPPGNNPPQFQDLDIPGYRSVDTLGFIQEDIVSGDRNVTGDCMRAIRIEVAPSLNARVPIEIVRFCQFFDKACDLTLRTACREALRLDSLSVGK